MFFYAFGIQDNLGNKLTVKYPATYSVEDKKGEQYLRGFPLCKLSDTTDYKHIGSFNFVGLITKGFRFFYCYYWDFNANWFYANNTFALSNVAGYIGSQVITAYLSVNDSEEIETLGLCTRLFYDGNRKANNALIFENVELKDSDKITVRFENAFTLGYFVTYEYSRDSDPNLLQKPMSYQASVIPWQDNVGVKRIGDYYIK